MSYESIQMSPCVGPGDCAVYYRTLTVTLRNSGGTLAGFNNIIAWANAYDMSTIQWGRTSLYAFDTPGDTLPDPVYTTENYGDGGHPFSRTDFYSFYDPVATVGPSGDLYRTQIWLGGPRAYMVLAMGNTGGDPSSGVSVVGCTFAAPNLACANGFIVDLPIPNAALGDYCDFYLFGVVGPNPTGGATGQYPDLATFARDILNNYGPNWDPTQTCRAAPGDPFRPVS